MIALTAAALGASLGMAAAERTSPAPSEPVVRESAGYEQVEIVERRITRQGYVVSKALDFSPEPSKLTLTVGAVLSAGHIDVVLRQVRVRYRFRASLDGLRGARTPRRTRPQP